MVKTDKNDEKLDTSNIFEEFSENDWLKDEVEKIIQSQNKNAYYYLKKIWIYLSTLFWLLLVTVLLVYVYVFIQEKDDLTNSGLLDPFCFIILWDVEKSKWLCSSISSENKTYTDDVAEIKQKQLKSIYSIIESLYKIENFSKTKEIIFLTEKTDLKLPVLKILEDFDNLINEFEPIEKWKLKCFDIEINNNYVFKARCDAYSTVFDSQIKWFDWTDKNKVWWKSVSYANSFINYIEKKSDNFTHMSKQKIFNSASLLGETTAFTNKTTFYLELKYNSNDLTL